MATTVNAIVVAAKSVAAAVLTDWVELRHVFDVAKNDFRNTRYAYGVRPLEADNAATVTGAYMLDHRFELILTQTVARTDDDSQIFTVLSDLYDKADQVYRQFENTKIGLGSTIALVTSPSLSEPEILTGTTVVLRMQFLVKYRHSIS